MSNVLLTYGEGRVCILKNKQFTKEITILCIFFVLFIVIGFFGFKVINEINLDVRNNLLKQKSDYNKVVEEFTNREHISDEEYLDFIIEQRDIANADFDNDLIIVDVAVSAIRFILCACLIAVLMIIVFTLIKDFIFDYSSYKESDNDQHNPNENEYEEITIPTFSDRGL